MPSSEHCDDTTPAWTSEKTCITDIMPHTLLTEMGMFNHNSQMQVSSTLWSVLSLLQLQLLSSEAKS